MKVNSIQQQNFRGGFSDKLASKIAKNPKLVGAIAGLAGCSVVAQKLVMSSGEATIGPVMDLTVGKAITKNILRTKTMVKEELKYVKNGKKILAIFIIGQ